MSTSAFLIAVVPLVGLLACLIFHRYPGELAIQRLRRLVALIFSPHAGLGEPLVTFRVRSSVRGGGLIAESLAGRGPPRSL